MAPDTHAHTHDGQRRTPRDRPDRRAQPTGPFTNADRGVKAGNASPTRCLAQRCRCCSMPGQADRRIERQRDPLSCSGRPHKTVRLPRCRKLTSYAGQIVTLCVCLDIRRRWSWFSLKGKAASGVSKGALPYATGAPSPTSRLIRAPRWRTPENRSVNASVPFCSRSGSMTPCWRRKNLGHGCCRVNAISATSSAGRSTIPTAGASIACCGTRGRNEFAS